MGGDGGEEASVRRVGWALGSLIRPVWPHDCGPSPDIGDDPADAAVTVPLVGFTILDIDVASKLRVR